MKVKVLGAYGSEGQGQRPTAFLVDDRVLVDAGTVGGALSVAEQIEIEYALLSHAHLDHIAGLAFLTDTLAMVVPARRVTPKRPDECRVDRHAAHERRPWFVVDCRRSESNLFSRLCRRDPGTNEDRVECARAPEPHVVPEETPVWQHSRPD